MNTLGNLGKDDVDDNGLVPNIAAIPEEVPVLGRKVASEGPIRMGWRFIPQLESGHSMSEAHGSPKPGWESSWWQRRQAYLDSKVEYRARFGSG